MTLDLNRFRSTRPADEPGKPRRPRTEGAFYLVPVAWMERANSVLENQVQLMFALRLYKRWKTRTAGAEFIVVGNCLIGGQDRWRRRMKQRALELLAAAGLLEGLSAGERNAACVRILDVPE